MEYVFGLDDARGQRTLRTRGETHSDLQGFCEVVREYDTSVITDNFRVVRKTHSDEDSEGGCYDWYDIDQCYRTIDYTKPVVAENEKLSAQNATLKQQVSALADQQSFYEDCIAEMASVVYA